ncbi:MAG: cyclic nucleotide-binding domain-containing protein [Acidimicrobiales bacterium]|nr:cyclic nucleotide-binding domain-containing protein [Acidimicrobiales bacterium]
MTSVDDQLAQMDFFRGLSKADLKKVRRLMTPTTIEAGKQFITEGTPGRQAFLILSGRATVRRGARVLSTVGPGDFLGEMSVLTGDHRTASVTADTDLDVEVLNRREFASLLEEQPKLAIKLLLSVVIRLRELEPGLIG